MKRLRHGLWTVGVALTAFYVTDRGGIGYGLVVIVAGGLGTWLLWAPQRAATRISLSRPYRCAECGAVRTSLPSRDYRLLQTSGDVICPTCDTRMEPEYRGASTAYDDAVHAYLERNQ